MATLRSVFSLKPNIYDPRFRGFQLDPQETSRLGLKHVLDDFKPENPMSADWEPRKLNSVWRPLHVVGHVAPFNDYPCIGIATPVFSRRAVDALGEFLTANGELLPLVTDVGEYYAFNLLTKVDALDLKKSRLRRGDTTKIATWIDYYWFKKAKLKNCSIFRIREANTTFFVTNQFKDRAEAAGLNGLHFIPVWPLPEDVDWSKNRATPEQKLRSKKLEGQCVILRLRLKKEKPDRKEQKFAEEIRASLQMQLKVSSLDEPYRGTIEAHEFEDGEFRIFCSCPDCEVLTEFLSEWFLTVPWDHDFDIVKRYGNLYDQKAKEKRLTIRNVSG